MYLLVIMALALLVMVVGLPITWWMDHSKEKSRKQRRQALLDENYQEHFPAVERAYFKWRSLARDDLSRAGKAGDELRAGLSQLDKGNQSRACKELDRHQTSADRGEVAWLWRRELQERAKAIGQPS